MCVKIKRKNKVLKICSRIVIRLANPVIIELEPDLRLWKGKTFGTEVALATPEGEAERNTGWLFMEIFIERFSFSL